MSNNLGGKKRTYIGLSVPITTTGKMINGPSFYSWYDLHDNFFKLYNRTNIEGIIKKNIFYRICMLLTILYTESE